MKKILSKKLPSGLIYKLPILSTETVANHSLDIMINFTTDFGWTWGNYERSESHWSKDDVVCNRIKSGIKIGNFTTTKNKPIYICDTKSNFLENYNESLWPIAYDYIKTNNEAKINFFEETLIKYDNEISTYEKNLLLYDEYFEKKKNMIME